MILIVFIFSDENMQTLSHLVNIFNIDFNIIP